MGLSTVGSYLQKIRRDIRTERLDSRPLNGGTFALALIDSVDFVYFRLQGTRENAPGLPDLLEILRMTAMQASTVPDPDKFGTTTTLYLQMESQELRKVMGAYSPEASLRKKHTCTQSELEIVLRAF